MTNIEAAAVTHQNAMELARLGRWQQAEQVCRALLVSGPERPETLSLLAVICLQTHRPAEAIAPLNKAVGLDGGQAMTRTLLGDALLEIGRAGDALTEYTKALDRAPKLPPALVGSAKALQQLCRYEDALAVYDVVVAGNANDAEAWFNRGNVLTALARQEEAVASYERAIRLRPGYADAWSNRGVALFQLRRLEAALASFEQAVAADRNLADAHRNRGAILELLSRRTEALAAFEAALSINGGDVEAHYARSSALHALGRSEDALDAVTRLLTISDDYAPALKLQGDIHASLHRYDQAAKSYARVLDLAPGTDYVAGALHHTQHWCADWKPLHPDATPARLYRNVLDGLRADHPFSFLAVSDDPAAQLQCSVTLIESNAVPRPVLRPATPYSHRRMRIAYVSGDFRVHAVSYLLAGVLESHDRSRFETVGVSLRPPERSALGQRMASAFNEFIDVSALTDMAAAARLRELEVDIAVDLSGHTSSRFGIFAQRPAPVQVQYLGFPGTTGAPFIDYLIADPFVIPPESAHHYSERIAYMPECFQANGDLRTRNNLCPSRQDVGLEPNLFVFCCFNNIYKINSDVFDIWMRVLRRVPNSVLWVFAGETATQNLRAEAARRDVDPSRLRLAPRVPYETHVARLPLADLFLDTLPFNGGATTSDALWSGLPVLTCAGRSFAGRMAGSLLHALGLNELIAKDWSAYEEIAVELAERPEKLNALRRHLAEARQATGVFDGARFCRGLETAYQTMLQTYERGDPPHSFTVES